MPQSSHSRNEKNLRRRDFYNNFKRSNACILCIRFSLIGDNLGLNTVLGFVSSFSANYLCRFCKEKKTSTHTSCVTKPNLLRNKENYILVVSANEKCHFIQYINGLKNLSVIKVCTTVAGLSHTGSVTSSGGLQWQIDKK